MVVKRGALLDERGAYTLVPYKGTSLIRNSAPLGPYRRNMPRALWWSCGGGGVFLTSEVPLHPHTSNRLGRATGGTEEGGRDQEEDGMDMSFPSGVGCRGETYFISHNILIKRF